MVAEHGWFAARPSGTEDIYKIYAESFRGKDHLRQIQAEAQQIVTATLLREARRSRGSVIARKDQGMNVPLYGNRSPETVTVDTLAELALDPRWSFNHSADKLWKQLDPELWDLTHNPWVVLQTVSPEKLKQVLADPYLQKLIADLASRKTRRPNTPGWFQRPIPMRQLSAVAYFSMEFMLSEALPIYSGGLGNVAGDQLKAASNLGVPVIGVGLLYQQGYFRQEIDAYGNQRALYPFNDPGQLPISRCARSNGEWLRLSIDFPGAKLWIRTWQVASRPSKVVSAGHQRSCQYSGLPRDHQRAVRRRLGVAPETGSRCSELAVGVCSGRSGFSPRFATSTRGTRHSRCLERARCYMEDHKQPFDLALTVTRAGNLFTTHTPVAAGFDRFAPDLMEKYLRQYAEKELSIPARRLARVGSARPRRITTSHSTWLTSPYAAAAR